MTDAAQYIQDTYEDLAAQGESNLCCSPLSLYTPEQIAALPDAVLKLSSGCGHPVDDAHLDAGMTVLDIGSGAGADCMLAARRVGPTGRVIGVDPSLSMRETATRHRDASSLHWIDYRAGSSEDLPVNDASIDVAISNCVLSLSTHPGNTWRDIARVVRPGGHAVVSDIVGGSASDPLLGQAKCETGITWPEYRDTLRRAGFGGIKVMHVRAATFRDGATAQSVTFDARRNRGRRHLAVDIVHDDHHRADADALIEKLTLPDAHRTTTCSIRRLSTTDPLRADIVDFISAGITTGFRVAVDGLVTATDLEASSVRNLLA